MKININAMKTGAVRFLSKSGLVLKKHSPKILLTLGAVGTVAGTVTACKATPKAVAAHENFCKEVIEIHATSEDKPAVKDIIKVYTRAGIRYLKVYGPSVAIILSSIGCNVGSYLIMNKRGVALAAALASTTAAFEEYRKSVADTYGEDAEREIRLGLRQATVEDCTDTEDAEAIQNGETKMTLEPMGYDRCFDEYNPMWTKSAVDNLNFLVQCQAYANEKLRRQGHLFVNELYDICHIKRVKSGQIDGWIYDPSRDDLHNFVDLGLYSVKDIPHDNFLRGMETSVWLTINPDGDILSLMK